MAATLLYGYWLYWLKKFASALAPEQFSKL
jgi:hypothetical protein